MLTRKDFEIAANKIGNIANYETRRHETLAYSVDAKKINSRFSYGKFVAWVECVAQEKSDSNRVQ